MPLCRPIEHVEQHAFGSWQPRRREGIVVEDRRGMLKASIAGVAGLSLPQLLASRARASEAGQPLRSKSVILLWMTGGPSHIDMWDLKPDAPAEIRGPFKPIQTTVPGVAICEHLPKIARMMNKLTLIRSVDCRFSNHEPNMVMQTANLMAEPRTNPEAPLYPAIGSIVARHRGRKQGMPPYVSLNLQDRSHLAWAGYLGRQYDPFNGKDVGRLLNLPPRLDLATVNERQRLRTHLDRLRHEWDYSGSMLAMDRFSQQAVDMVMGPHARVAFDVSREPDRIRDRYGVHPWLQSALLARRLVEAGVSFITIDLSHHSASGTWDTHGDNIPPYGGISKGLKPLLPVFDHLLTTLVEDLDERGLLNQVLVLAMGEFGRTPTIGTQDSTDGRDHWPVVTSMTMAGGGLRHGQLIGATERDAGHIKERPVTPGDLAATIYRHMDVPLDLTYDDTRGRPRNIIEQGKPIDELF